MVLDGINFILNKGEVVVILGFSGCGKSIFLKCLNGFEKIDEGEIFFENINFNNKIINWN